MDSKYIIDINSKHFVNPTIELQIQLAMQSQVPILLLGGKCGVI